MKTKFSLKLMFLILALFVVSQTYGARPTFWTYDCSAAPTWDTGGNYTGGTISFLDGKMDLTCTGATFYPRIQFGTVMNTWYPIDLSLTSNSFAKFRIKCTAAVPVKLVCEPRQTTGSADMTQTISINNTGVWQNILFSFPYSSKSNYVTGFTFKITNGSGAFVAFSASIDEITFGTDLSTDYYRSKATGSWSDFNTWESSSDNSAWMNAHLTPTASATSIGIMTGHEVSISTNTNASSVSINPGAKVTLNNTYTLSANSLNINSDGTNGTGTFVDLTTAGGLTVSGTTTVQQYLTSSAIGVTGRNWYISSPLSAAASSTITAATGNGLVYYDGTSNWPDAGLTMDVMKGYIAKSPAQNTTITFSGGTLNTGAQTVNNLPVGFNLVGNPYPSYVNWTEATKSNVTNSIWYRSKKTGSYNFHTYNVTGGVGVNDGTDIIPPMQSFWIKTTSATNSLSFTNAMRSHQDQSIETNRLKAPKVQAQKLLRLQVSNGTNKDEAVVYFNSDAQNSVDEFDSQKMFNSVTDVPEIYTQIGTDKLVINGMKDVQYNTEIPVGFSTLQTNNFSIKASESNNFDNNILIILKDKELLSEHDLTNGTAYNFESGVTNTSDRFSLIFRIKDTATDLTNNSKELNVKVFVNAQNQIILIAPEKCNYAIYNAVGQKQCDGILKLTEESINKHFNLGVYFVELSQNGLHEIKKVVIR